MLLRRAATLTSALALAVALSSVAAVGEAETPHGAAGIGDAYFPLDGNGGIDVQSYDIHDRYRFRQARLSGRTVLRLTATQAIAGFNLDFLLPVSRVEVDHRSVPFEHARHELTVDAPLREGQAARVEVWYSGRPARYSYAGESNWLADDHEVVAMNQPHMAPWWFPANDHPLDKSTVRISITVPKAKRVVANGHRVGRTVHGALATTTWAAGEPMVPYLAFFAAGAFQVESGTSDGRPWYVAVSKGLGTASQRVAMRLMKQTPALLHWLEGEIGAYPFRDTGGLTTSLPVGFALENQTRPTYPYMGEGPGAVVTVVHELAHQWFGDSVAVAGWQDIWLNEGWATYLENLYRETHGGPTTDVALRETYADIPGDDAFWEHEVADPCPDHVDCVGPIFDDFVYERGAMALAALRNRIGDTAFSHLMRRWAGDHAGGNGNTAQFEALAEDVSDQDLGSFFDAWVRSTTKPADTVENGLG